MEREVAASRFFFINTVMKSFKQILSEAKQIDFSKLSMQDIDKHHSKLTPEEQKRFSDLIKDESSVPVLIQQRQALQQIHQERKK